MGDLCREYDLPRIAPLTKYGSWQAAYPEIIGGIKRGFSYFHHVAGQPFVADERHSTELLVAASSSDQFADTHWLRQDVDAFLFREAQSAGVICIERTEVAEIELHGEQVALCLRPATSVVEATQSVSDWRSHAPRGNKCEYRARFVVDGSGDGGFLARRLSIADKTRELRTQSRTVFAHFADVTRWHRHLEATAVSVAEHPFDCDHAALHHVFDGGWMWQLRFNDETVSAGFVQDLNRDARQPPAPEAEWAMWLERFPSIAEQYSAAKIVRPATGLRATGRMQRKLANAVGPWWALLPNTAGFIDPLHSSGIAHTLCGIERLARILIRHLGRDDLPVQLRKYEVCVLAEIELIDLLVSGCFAALGEFRLFAAISMLYFAAATSYERARVASTERFAPAFLRADEPDWRAVVSRMWGRLHEVVDERRGDSETPRRSARDCQGVIERFEAELADAVRPFNVVGLCDPSLRNMYRHSALPE